MIHFEKLFLCAFLSLFIVGAGTETDNRLDQYDEYQADAYSEDPEYETEDTEPLRDFEAVHFTDLCSEIGILHNEFEETQKNHSENVQKLESDIPNCTTKLYQEDNGSEFHSLLGAILNSKEQSDTEEACCEEAKLKLSWDHAKYLENKTRYLKKELKKTKKKNSEFVNQLKRHLKECSQKSTSRADCLEIFQHYLAFFLLSVVLRHLLWQK